MTPGRAGLPRERKRSGSRGKRTSSGMSERRRLRRCEGYGACEDANGGCISRRQVCRHLAMIHRIPAPKRCKKICSRPDALGRERCSASWCHPNSRQGSPVSFGLRSRGEGAAGVSAPAPPLSFVWSGRGAFSGASLSVGRRVRVLLRHRSGMFWLIVFDAGENVKR